jgi:hypothetical protein
MDRVLIIGDSFSADWSVKYKDQAGWPNLLSKNFRVTNLSQAGCSEYKIYQQLISADLNNFDCIVVSHTSPNRVPVTVHPIHNNDVLHNNCDLIYADLKNYEETRPDVKGAIEFFEKFFDYDYANFVHLLIGQKINDVLTNFQELKKIHICHMNFEVQYKFYNMVNFEPLYAKHKGLINHYSEKGNKLVENTVTNLISGESDVATQCK